MFYEECRMRLMQVYRTNSARGKTCRAVSALGLHSILSLGRGMGWGEQETTHSGMFLSNYQTRSKISPQTNGNTIIRIWLWMLNYLAALWTPAKDDWNSESSGWDFCPALSHISSVLCIKTSLLRRILGTCKQNLFSCQTLSL